MENAISGQVIKKIFIATGPNLDLLCVQQLDAAPFYENCTKHYFAAKHLEKGLDRGWCGLLATAKNSMVNAVFLIWLVVELPNLCFPNT